MIYRLLTTAAAIALAVPAFAADADLSGAGYVPPPGDPVYSQTSMVAGDVQLALGYTSIDGLGDEKSFWTFDGWARANIDLNSWNLLVETGGGAFFGGDIPDGLNSPSINVFGHVWGGDNVEFGAFGGAGFQHVTIGVVGVEAEADVGNATLGGQGFYLFTSENVDIDAWGLRGWADYYFTPNTKVTGEVVWATFDGGDLFGARGRVTHRFAGTPINIFGEGSYFTVSDADIDGFNVMGGFSVLFDGGAPTQQEFDRSVPFDFRVPSVGFIEGISFSDRRLKADIVQVGMLTKDIPLYRFRYIWGDEVFVGVMAQDVLAVRPDAVVMGSHGYYAVDYAALGTRMMRWEEWQAAGSAGLKTLPASSYIAAPAG